MDIITRQDARRNLQKTYFTGQPCKNGHIAYRYTQSGSCSQCIKEANGSFGVATDPVVKAAKAEMVAVRLRAYDADFEVLTAALWAIAIARCDALSLGDIRTRRVPTNQASGTALYSFMCFAEDLPQVREVAEALIRSHSIDPEAARAQALRRANALVEEVRAPSP